MTATGLEISDDYVMSCIYPCMKQVKCDECACPVFTVMQLRLKAWNHERDNWHREVNCTCDLDCGNPESIWRQASRRFSSFMNAVACPKRAHPGLEIPHAPDDPPEFRCVACCSEPRSNGATCPAGVPPCRECGWARKFGASCVCSAEYTDDPCIWKRPMTVDAGNSRSETRYVNHTGARKELIDEIRDAAPAFLHHQWVRLS